MISVAEALEMLFALTPAPGAPESVPLRAAAGRVLLEDQVARRAQPPFAASAMDGYAVAGGPPAPGTRFRILGEAAAGRRWPGRVGPGEAIRIFTGAPIPEGADFVVIQEDTARISTELTVTRDPGPASNIRPAGGDFAQGFALSAPRRLGPQEVALLAAMNCPRLPVARQPVVAILSTGDELVMPGETPGEDQIIASNTFGIAALVAAEGGIPRILPIARDTRAALEQGFVLAKGADLIVTIGGASVGDHDLVAGVAQDMGADMAFHKVAMRPGKPLMAGRIGSAMMVGLPGNPVSAMICGHIFLRPVLRAMQGLPRSALPRRSAPLADPVEANGPREHYMRAHLGPRGISPAQSQDSALLTVLADSCALILRPPNDPSRAAGEMARLSAVPVTTTSGASSARTRRRKRPAGRCPVSA